VVPIGRVRRRSGAVLPPGCPVVVTLVRENYAMVISAEPVGETRRQVVSAGIALLCLAVVLLDAGVDLLPDEPVVWIVTPVRLLVGVGLVAAVVGMGSPLRLWTVLDAAVAGLVLASALATMAAGQDWSGWRAVVTAIAAYYLAVAVRRSSFGSPGVIGLLALTGCALAAISAVRQGLAGEATGFCRGAANATADTCGPGALIRVTGTFSNPNLLAAFLVLLLPLAAVGSAPRACSAPESSCSGTWPFCSRPHAGECSVRSPAPALSSCSAARPRAGSRRPCSGSGSS
jgi:hypothetical protein